MAQINQLSVTSGSVSLPNSGSVAIFSNIEDNGNLYVKTSAGTVTPVGNTSGGGGSSGSSGTSGTSGAGSSGTGGTSGTSGAGSSGTGGTSGTSGTQGATGTNGTSGTQGATGTGGTSGTSGNGTAGTSGTGGAGTSGTSGAVGATGTSGTSGAVGATGTSGTSGVNGTSGTGGTGTSGTSGAAGASGTSGTSGAGGSGGTAIIYNTVSRYQAYLSGDIECYLVSSATVNTGLTWSRSGTTLTITHNSHGRSNGDMVIVRNANADNFNGTITVVDTNTFTLTTVNSGGTSGTEAAYSLGLTVGTPTAAAMTITAPTGGDVQLLSVLFATGARSGTNLAITVPQSATNGAGANTTGQNSFYPIVRVQTISTGAVQGATLTLNTASNFNVFNFGSMNATLSNLVRLDF